MKKDSLTYLIYIILLPALLFTAAYLARASRPDIPVHKKTSLMMGTIVEISIAGGEDKDLIKKAFEDAFEEMSRIDRKFSAYKEDSDVSRINRLKPGEWLVVDDETFRLIEESVEYSKFTDGAFDITVKPLVDLWGFFAHQGHVPSKEEIARALENVGSDKLILDKANKGIALARDGVKIDLGGIAKGYATDMAIASLSRGGIRNAIVNSGGDMYCMGRKSALELWRVGIQHPRKKGRLIAEVSLEDAAINPSGDYENFFEVGGRRFCHIIDPRTGMPVGSVPSSATIIAGDSTRAQALAKVPMVLGAAVGARGMEKRFAEEWIVISEGPEGALAIQKSNGIAKYAYKEN